MVNYKTLNYRTFDSAARRRLALILPATKVRQKIPWRKFLSLSLASVLLVGSNIAYLHPTMSYFTDKVQSSSNVLTSGTLSFAVTSPEGFEPKKIKKGDPSIRLADVTKTGSLDFQYTISSQITSTDTSLCSALKLKAILDKEGDKDDLVGYVTDAQLFTQPIDSWKFKLSLPKGFKTKNLSSKECEFDLVFTGSQPGIAPNTGFTDTKILHNIVRIKSKKDSDDDKDNNKDCIDIEEDEDEDNYVPDHQDQHYDEHDHSDDQNNQKDKDK
jgi:hypothetical protein